MDPDDERFELHRAPQSHVVTCEGFTFSSAVSIDYERPLIYDGAEIKWESTRTCRALNLYTGRLDPQILAPLTKSYKLNHETYQNR